MSGGRWKYKTETVTLDGNTVQVRGLTAGERTEFAQLSKRIKAGEAQAIDVPAMVARMGMVEPKLETDAEVSDMPGLLLEAVVAKILELSGVDKAEADPEKKEVAPVQH